MLIVEWLKPPWFFGRWNDATLEERTEKVQFYVFCTSRSRSDAGHWLTEHSLAEFLFYRLHWCNPGEWGYLLRTLLVWLWRVWKWIEVDGRGWKSLFLQSSPIWSKCKLYHCIVIIFIFETIQYNNLQFFLHVCLDFLTDSWEFVCLRQTCWNFFIRLLNHFWKNQQCSF